MSQEERPRTDGGTVYLERRKKSDWIVKMAAILSALSWVLMLAVWAFLDRASPDSQHIFNQIFNVQGRTRWDVTLLPIAFALLLTSLGVCILGFFFNKMRMKRKTDKYRKSIFVIGGITIIGLVVFLIRFGSYFLW